MPPPDHLLSAQIVSSSSIVKGERATNTTTYCFDHGLVGVP